MFRDEDEALSRRDVDSCGDFKDDMLELLGKVVWNDGAHQCSEHAMLGSHP